MDLSPFRPRHPTMQRVGDMETYNGFLGNAAALSDRGDPRGDRQRLRRLCAKNPRHSVIRYEAGMAMV
jgi:hypothetical protein